MRSIRRCRSDARAPTQVPVLWLPGVPFPALPHLCRARAKARDERDPMNAGRRLSVGSAAATGTPQSTPAPRPRGDDNRTRRCGHRRPRLRKQRGAEAASELRLTRQGSGPQVKAYPGCGTCRASSDLPSLITEHGPFGASRTAYPKRPTTDRAERGIPSNRGGPIPAPSLPVLTPRLFDPSRRSEPHMNEPRKSRKASRCRVCAADIRRGDLIVYLPRDAQAGQPRTWIHDRCDS